MNLATQFANIGNSLGGFISGATSPLLNTALGGTTTNTNTTSENNKPAKSNTTIYIVVGLVLVVLVVGAIFIFRKNKNQ